VMQRGLHAYMESWGLAVENLYYQVTAVTENSRSEMSLREIMCWLLTSWCEYRTGKEDPAPVERGRAGRLSFRVPNGAAQHP
jgi:hypothetical protein